MNILNGYKTYIGAALFFVLGGLVYTGTIDNKTAETLGFIIAGWTGFAVRSAIKNLE